MLTLFDLWLRRSLGGISLQRDTACRADTPTTTTIVFLIRSFVRSFVTRGKREKNWTQTPTRRPKTILISLILAAA
jgi:hypothetical protein